MNIFWVHLKNTAFRQYTRVTRLKRFSTLEISAWYTANQSQKIMRLLWIICNGLTYWLEHTDQGDEDPLGSFLAFPWQPPPVFCTALILIYNFEGWQFNKGGSNCCSFDLRQTKVSAHHLSVHGHVCKLETCSKRVQNFSGIGDKQNQYFGPIWEFGTLAVHLDQTSISLLWK